MNGVLNLLGLSRRPVGRVSALLLAIIGNNAFFGVEF